MPEAERKFFKALRSVIGDRFIKYKPDLEIHTNFEDNCYSHEVCSLADNILNEFHSERDFVSRKIPVDGMILEHPLYGTRIIEFDEFQHFTIMRRRVIEISNSLLPLSFYLGYLEIISKPSVITSVTTVTSRKGFRTPVAGFRFSDGRMYQRAYYDFLKDYIHLSTSKNNYSEVIRFAMPDFNVNSNSEFLRLPDTILCDEIDEKIVKWRL